MRAIWPWLDITRLCSNETISCLRAVSTVVYGIHMQYSNIYTAVHNSIHPVYEQVVDCIYKLYCSVHIYIYSTNVIIKSPAVKRPSAADR